MEYDQAVMEAVRLGGLNLLEADRVKVMLAARCWCRFVSHTACAQLDSLWEMYIRGRALAAALTKARRGTRTHPRAALTRHAHVQSLQLTAPPSAPAKVGDEKEEKIPAAAPSQLSQLYARARCCGSPVAGADETGSW
jgi:hypothetical protein